MKKSTKIILGLAIIIVLSVVTVLVTMMVLKGKTYDVKFITHGGTEVLNQEVNKGENILRPEDPTKEGYSFDGWYINGEKYDFSKPINGDLILEAKWVKIEVNEKVTVKFDSRGGSSVASSTIDKNTKVLKPSNPTRYGYTFKGWTLNGKAYDFNTLVASDITLVATWEKQNIAFYGDVNGDGVVNNNDATTVLSYIDEKIEFNSEQKKNADVNTDGYIDNVDYALILGVSQGYFKNTLPSKAITDYVIYGDTLNMGIYEEEIDSPMPYYVVEQYVNGNTGILEGQALKNSDVNGDGFVNYVDRAIMFWYVNGYFQNELPGFKPLTNYILYGDVSNDGIVDDKDKTLLSKYLNNQENLSVQGLKNADINGDGNINGDDLQKLNSALTSNLFGGNIPRIYPIK